MSFILVSTGYSFPQPGSRHGAEEDARAARLFGIDVVEDGAEGAAQPPEANAPAKTVESTEVRQAVAEAEKSLRGGSYDEAAAQLLKIRISGVQFSEKDAAAYRNALQEAYSRALESAGNGDPRGKAAVEMIRAARGR